MRAVSLVGIFGLLVVGLVACGNKKATSSDTSSGYRNSISKGLDAVAENKMDKALTYFDNALTQKPKDTKAKAYRDQVQSYVDTNSQLKVTDGNYSSDVLKQCKNIDWNKKPYLSKLKSKVNKLIKKSNQNGSSSSSVASTSSSSADTKVSAANKKEADQMRQNIVLADPDHWDSAALAQVPDSVILAATKKSNDAGGDPGTTANMIAEQYPDIKKNSSLDNSNESADTSMSTDKERADSVRAVLANNQGFSESVLAAISDDEILNAVNGSFMSNADIARTAGTLLQNHPDLKQ